MTEQYGHAHIDTPDHLGREQFSITDLSTEFGVTARALRFYEDEGLISPSRKGLSRIYSKRDRARLAWILRGKRVGFSLTEIREMIDLYDADEAHEAQRRVTVDKCKARIDLLTRQKDDIDAAIAGALASKYRNAGQTCVCANRILVQASIHDAFAEKLAAAVRAFKVGDGMGDGTQIGPLINAAAADKVASLVSQAEAAGASVLVGGQAHPAGPLFYHPTILTGVAPDNPILQEEIFGPVAPLVRFETEAEAIAIANDTPYGLAAYFYGRDIARVWRVAEGLEYGMVGINEGLISTEVAPFGGVKQSGLGREGSHHGTEDYLEMKYICLSV